MESTKPNLIDPFNVNGLINSNSFSFQPKSIKTAGFGARLMSKYEGLGLHGRITIITLFCLSLSIISFLFGIHFQSNLNSHPNPSPSPLLVNGHYSSDTQAGYFQLFKDGVNDNNNNNNNNNNNKSSGSAIALSCPKVKCKCSCKNPFSSEAENKDKNKITSVNSLSNVKIVSNLVSLEQSFICQIDSDPFLRATNASFISFIPGTHNEIPRLMHQSWKSLSLPSSFAEWSLSWRKNHEFDYNFSNPIKGSPPSSARVASKLLSWRYMLWTDTDNDYFVRSQYPWFYPIYSALPTMIMKADTVRYMYMHAFGGLYADLDFMSIKNIEPFIQSIFKQNPKTKIILSWLGGYDNIYNNSVKETGSITSQIVINEIKNFGQLVPNAFLISAPGHEFWLHVLQRIEYLVNTKLKIDSVNGRPLNVEVTTGPEAVSKTLLGWFEHNHQRLNEIFIADGKYLYPIDWRSKDPNIELLCGRRKQSSNEYVIGDLQKCLKLFPNAYAITFWTHSWKA